MKKIKSIINKIGLCTSYDSYCKVYDELEVEYNKMKSEGHKFTPLETADITLRVSIQENKLHFLKAESV